MDYKERIEEYLEEVKILDELYQAVSNGDKEKAEKLEKELDKFKLKLDINTKKARLYQLEKLMADAEKQFKAEKKHMHDNWKSILKKSMDIKDKLQKDDKRLVMSFKDRDIKKAWVNDKEKLQAYKTMINILNQNSNGKSI